MSAVKLSAHGAAATVSRADFRTYRSAEESDQQQSFTQRRVYRQLVGHL